MIYLKIGEQSYPFAFGLSGARRFEETAKRPVGSVLLSFSDGDMGKIMFSDVTLLISCGLENGSQKAKAPKSFPVELVEEMLDDCPDMWAVITKALEELANSLNKQEIVPQEAKKKTAKQIAPTAKPG